MYPRTLLSVRLLLLAALLASLAGVWLAGPAAAQDEAQTVVLLTFDGALTQPKLEYIERGLNRAAREAAELVILELNTPGGSTLLMNEIVQNILSSTVPVVVYVAPRGAMAGSAGTLITLAGHAAAMAPETIIGAASPVDMSGRDLNETIAAKEKEALMATARTLAARRPPEAIRLAEQTIDTARAVSANEALEIGLVDFIAVDVTDLLRQLDGFEVQIGGEQRTLQTTGALVEAVPQSIVGSFLDMITDPNIIILLLNLGVMAILIEISTPGGWVAGFIGVTCLALATYGLGILPVNWFGLVFLLLAFVLFLLDIKAPTHGALTAAGVGSLIAGSLVLFNTTDVPGLPQVSVPLVIFSSLFTGGVFFMILLFALRAQGAPIRMGQESLAGRVGVVVVPLNPHGQVRVGGEQWSAERMDGEDPLPVGARVRVVSLEGLRLHVVALPEESPETA